MRKTILLPIFILSFFSGFTQNLTDFIQFQPRSSLLQPAALKFGMDMNDRHWGVLKLNHRRQWAGLSNNALETYILEFESLIYPSKKSSFQLLLGGIAFTDQFGPTVFTGGKLRLGGVLNGREFGKLAIGFSVGFSQFRIKSNELDFLNGAEPLAGIAPNQGFTTVGLGVFYSKPIHKHRLILGMGLPEIFGLDFNNGETDVVRQYLINGMAGFNFSLSQGNWLNFSVDMRTLENEKREIEYLSQYYFSNQIHFGLGYSNRGALRGEAGFLLGGNAKDRIDKLKNNLRITVAYHYSTNEFRALHGDTFEVSLIGYLKRNTKQKK